MPVCKLAPIDIPNNDPKWAALSLNEAIWVGAFDDVATRQPVESATP
jgi:hypothetical protein